MSSSSDNDISMSDPSWIQQFERLCSSEDLSLDKLQRMTEGISLDNLHNSSFLHRVCMNKNVTLEIVKYLLELYPQAINCCTDILYNDEEGDHYFIGDVNSAYPLHVACYNDQCPNEVIQFLLAKSSLKLHVSYMNFEWSKSDYSSYACYDEHGGYPLHYYLSRTSNVSLDIVKQLVANPEALLLNDEETMCTPIHILMHNKNIGEMTDVLHYLAELNPDSLKIKDRNGECSLHIACKNEHIIVESIRVLLESCMELARQQTWHGDIPIHSLCETKGIDDSVSRSILKLLLEAYPDSAMQVETEYGELPLHRAAYNKSPAFCKLLVDAYPESVKRGDVSNCLPIHNACYKGRLETVEYLFGLYPESLHIRLSSSGYLPIHYAAYSSGEDAAEIIKFIVRQDPECLSKPIVSGHVQRGDGTQENNYGLPLHIVCRHRDQSNVTELLYDLYPEAILIRNGDQQLPIDILMKRLDEAHRHGYSDENISRIQEPISFLRVQMGYAWQVQDENAMRTPDNNGLLPLHYALQNSAPLGSIKLLVKGNSDAINVPDGSGMHPFNIACQFSTIGVVKYLVEPERLSSNILNTYDVNKNFPLHHACRGGNCDVISYLLETPMASASVSERNSDGMLPIHLFCEFVKGRWCEGETPEYTETIWRLLTAYPETVLNW